MRRKLLRILGVFAALLMIVIVAGVLVVRSQWFHDYVQRRIVEEAQRITGAQVEMGGFSFDWTLMQARVDRLTLHGKEAAGEAPLVQLDAATLGLRIISIMERKVDLASLRVERPQVHIIIYPDGSTNFPGPGGAPRRLWSEQFLNLKIGQYEIVDGMVEYDNRRTPVNIRGENLRIQMSYDAATPSYRGEFASDRLRLTPPGFEPIETSVQTAFTLERDRLTFADLHVNTGESTADLQGVLEDMRNPRGTLSMRATARVSEAVRRLKLPIPPQGTVDFVGQLTVSFVQGFDFSMNGTMAARGLRYAQGRLEISDATVQGGVRLDRNGVSLDRFRAQMLGGNVAGNARLDRWRQFHVEGTAEGFGMRRMAALLTDRPVAWDGVLQGSFSADATLGQTEAIARASMTILPLPEVEPIQGHVDVVYDQAAGTVALGSSVVETRASRAEVEGTLGRTLRVRLRSTNLDDLLPAIAVVQDNPPSELPLKLNTGSANLDGTVTGALNDPHFHGQAALVNVQVRGYTVDRFTAEIDASRREVLARNLTAARGTAEATGTAALTAREGSFQDAEMTARLNVQGVQLQEVVREAGFTQEITGVAAATVRVSGSVQRPEADVNLDVRTPAALGERIDRLRADIHYAPGFLNVMDGIADDGPSQVRFTGSYKHPQSDWKSGDILFDAVTQNLPVNRLERAARFEPAVDSVLNGRVHATGRVNNGNFVLSEANADVSARDITVAGQPVGALTILAETRGSDLKVNAGGNILEAIVEGSGAWRLEGDAPGNATVRFSRLTVDSAHKLVMLGRPPEENPPPPFEGFIEGGARLSVSLERLEAMQAEVTLNTVQVNPRPNQVLRLGVQPGDVILRNSEPVIVDISRTEARVRSAKFTGRDTSMNVTGTIPFQRDRGADLAVNGNINLIILQLLNPDLAAQGVADVQAMVRGSLQNPNVNGRLELDNASLFLADFPNGVDNVNGSIRFDRNRATIEKLTAETGGGRVEFSGFIDFGTTLSYRVQARAIQVRVRYPQDVSTTFNGNVALNGTSQASRLTGTITLNRAAFTPSTDLGQLLAQFSESVRTPAEPNEYLRGLQLDLRVESSPNFQLETTLTRDVEAEVDLRVSGTPLRPSLLGTVSINRGELQVFGNEYTVDRGDIRFLNPVKIEPTVDLYLSTRARGVTVNISLSGTFPRVNPNFSSDPPLQTSEIFALLAVGRDPTQAASQSAPGLGMSSTSTFAQAGGGLLGQAVSAQVSNRLQRFFGASRVKIDPTLTGVDNIPQARLTWEQQVSKDITLTYITNLNRTNEQLVRFQWDLNRQWSAIAVRDTNGLFGVDFQYRKRIK